MQRSPQLRFHNSRQKNQQKKETKMSPLTHFKKILILPLLIPLVLGCFALSPTAQAITDAKAEDTHNKYKNVGTFIVIRGPNPIGLPPGIAATATAVLFHERVLLSAGHFVARAYNNGNGVPFFSTVVVSFSPDNALDPSTWFFDGEVIDIASDGNDDCATGDVRARVDTPEVRAWIFDTIAARLGN
jgi:hypothetical protein